MLFLNQRKFIIEPTTECRRAKKSVSAIKWRPECTGKTENMLFGLNKSRPDGNCLLKVGGRPIFVYNEICK
jgi:hypothetical protein